MITELTDDDLVEEYRCHHSWKDNPWLWILGGAFGILMAFFGFAVGLMTRPDPLRLQLMTTLPLMMGGSAIIRGFSLRKIPTGVKIEPDGLFIYFPNETIHYQWAEIGLAKVETSGMHQKKNVTLYNREGKVLHRLQNTFDSFEQMSESILSRVERKSGETAEKIKKKHSRKEAWLCFGVGLFFACAGAFMAWDTFETQRRDTLLKEVAIEGEAEIVRRFVAPNGVTHRLEYRVTNNLGTSATRNAEVEVWYWDSLDEVETVPVRYVEEFPKYSELIEGEVKEEEEFTESVSGKFLITGIASLFSLVGLTVGVLGFCGINIKIGEGTRKKTS